MKALVVLGGVVIVLVGLFLYWSGAGEQPPSGGMTLITTKELSSPKEAMAQGLSGVTWYAPTQAPGTWHDPATGQASAEAAVRDAASRLSAVNYAALSLPDFKSETAALTLQPDAFKSGSAWLDSRAVGQAGERWELYGWRGQEFPQKTDRPLVHRYVQIYALYDTGQKKVTKLLATIAGEVLE